MAALNLIEDRGDWGTYKLAVLEAVVVGLVGEVFPKLRRVDMLLDVEKVELVFFHDGELSEGDAESISCVQTEVECVLRDEIEVVVRSVRADFPGPVSVGFMGTTVFGLREEY